MIDSLTTHSGQVVIHRIDSIEANESPDDSEDAVVILHSGYEEYEIARFYKLNRNPLGTPDLKAERLKSPKCPLYWAVVFIGYLS